MWGPSVSGSYYAVHFENPTFNGAGRSAILGKLGADVGYGFGWRLQAGSITPYWRDYWGINHYVFIDSTGAEYRLDVNTNGIWTSREGIYLEYDPATCRLYFPDGSFWVMGAISAGTEQDAGTRYPTIIQDTNGNQILVRYHPGVGVSWPDSSARINEIEDVRATGIYPLPYRTYRFWYNSDPMPHATGIGNTVGTSESYVFSYFTQNLVSPFTPPVSYGQTTFLQAVTITDLGLSHQFQYDSATAGELTRVTLPYGASLRWAYQNYTYPGYRTLREVATRHLSPASGAPEQTWTFSYCADGNALVHPWTVLSDPSGTGKAWWFVYWESGGWQVGLEYQREDRPSPWATGIRRHNYTWVQDAAGSPYISTVLTTLDVGAGYQKQTKTEQTLDTHGNVLETKIYDYNSLVTPARTYTNTYLTNTNYTSRHIWNRLVSSTVTGGGQAATLVTNTYDTGQLVDLPSAPPVRNWVFPGWPATYYRGNVTRRVTPGKTVNIQYYHTGDVYKADDNNNHTIMVTEDSSKNYAVPGVISTGNLTNSMTWTSFLGLASETGPNGESAAFAYDSLARPKTTTSPHGATTEFTYTNSPPTRTATVKRQLPGGGLQSRWTKTTMDGLGRTVKVERGYDSTTVSVVDTEYAPCACSPFGRLKRVSQPYAPGEAVYWTTYTYDALGRTTQVDLPGGTGSTTYVYEGNTVKVTDPAGKWKKYTLDAVGNLVQVSEPAPEGGTHETYYTYNVLKQLTQVSMPRGGSTQTRTFNYDLATGRLASATNPENGTVSYTYNNDGTLQKRTDARGQRVEYTYDNLR